MWNGGTLATAGNLVFQGTAAGELLAHDAGNGDVLWRYNAGVGVSAAPMTYTVDDTQYVAVLAGWGGAGYIGASSAAQHGWAYNQQPRRLLVFSLEGKAEPPPTKAPKTVVDIIDDVK